MAERATSEIRIVWEDELRAAAKALEKLTTTHPEPITQEDVKRALDLCFVAIGGVHDSEAPLIVGDKRRMLKVVTEKANEA